VQGCGWGKLSCVQQHPFEADVALSDNAHQLKFNFGFFFFVVRDFLRKFLCMVAGIQWN
jgi:hypothetical protein